MFLHPTSQYEVLENGSESSEKLFKHMHVQSPVPQTELELILKWTQACICFKHSVRDSTEYFQVRTTTKDLLLANKNTPGK